MKNTNPKFSVLLPTHNRANVLGFAIASVLEQTETDFELLIVADGCNQDTLDVISTFNDSRIRVFNLPKAPYFGYANRNIALRESRGRLIAFVGHDDLLLQDHLELMGNLLDSTQASWAHSRPLWVSTDGIIVPFCTNLSLDGDLEYFLNHGNTLPATCIVHTREALEKNGFWPEDLSVAADWELWKRMIRSSKAPVAFLREPTSLHFSAKWKCSRYSGTKEVETLLNIAEKSQWWPEILRYDSSIEKDSEPEQTILWAAIRSGHKPWIKDLRIAVNTVIDQIAWKSIQKLIPEYDAILKSRSWKAIKLLHFIEKTLRNFIRSNLNLSR